MGDNMGTYVFSGGNGTYGFNMLEWSAADLIGLVQVTLSSSTLVHSGDLLLGGI